MRVIFKKVLTVSGQKCKTECFTDLQSVFKQFDIDGDGYIQEEELRQVMTKMGQNPTDEEIKAMFKAADINRDGKISFEGIARVTDAAKHRA
jgi:Ca2+-binding EF-hand superfamily protein